MDCPMCCTEMEDKESKYSELVCPLCGYEIFINIPDEYYEDIKRRNINEL